MSYSGDQNKSGGSQATQTMPAVVYVRPRRGRWLLVLIGVIGLGVASVFGLKAVNLWPTLQNPFVTKTTDRTGPVLLQSIQDLSRYVAAEGNFEVIVDLQKDKPYIPDWVYNERTLFVGAGSVDAYVDFSTLTTGAIKVSADGKAVEVTLPAPVLDTPKIDNDRSYVYEHSTGLVNKVGSMFGGDVNKQAELYKLANRKIADAAARSGLRDRAQTNTKNMLISLMKGLGFERVTVTFTPAPSP